MLDDPATREAVDLDRALELTEADRLAASGSAVTDGSTGSSIAVDLRGVATQLRGRARPMRFAPGEPLMVSGEPAPGVLVIEQGWAEVEGVLGARRQRLGPGSVLGEISLVVDDVATSTVTARSEVDALVIDHAALRDLTTTNPDLAARFYRSLSQVLARRLLRANAELDSYNL